jgi:hypothetical protein
MGRQFRGQRSVGPVSGGSFREFVNPAPTSAVGADGGASPSFYIPSYGVTNISTWAASTYVMAAPSEGVIKTILSSNPSSAAAAARVIKLSSGNTVTVGYVSPTTGASGNTHLSFGASTADFCLTLMGVNSTHWAIVSVHPVTTASTGFIGFLST